MPLTVTVTGASGFVGSHLCQALVEAGHHVRAMTRHPDTYEGAGDPVYGDVSDADSLGPALDGADAAYYLVHSLDREDFESADAQAAKDFSAAAAKAGVRRVVYLGGLGREDQDLSAHLRSRREVEHLLGGDGVPVTVLRAAIVVGHGGISWEITRQLVDHLPAMVVPYWTSTKTQPIALADAVAYLVGVLEPAEAEGRVFEIGGPEVLTYAQMMQRASQVIKHRPLPMLVVPLLTPRLSSHWLAFVTDVAIKRVVPRRLLGYDDAVRAAMAERQRATAGSATD